MRIVGRPTIKDHNTSLGGLFLFTSSKTVISTLRGWRGFGSADSMAISARVLKEHGES